jgi:subtilisin family serine protease
MQRASLQHFAGADAGLIVVSCAVRFTFTVPTVRRFVPAVFVLALGCSRTPAAGVAPAPVSFVIPGPLPPAADVPADSDRAGLPRNWHRLDPETDHIAGVSSERAMRELLAGRAPARTVIVAVIDGGVDTAHAGLRANLWTNTREVAANQTDDDKNGYVDDLRGWNFIGGRDGRNVEFDTFEATRVYVRCRARAGKSDFSSLPPQDAAECSRASVEYDKQRAEMSGALPNVEQAAQVLTMVENALKGALKTDSVTEERVRAIESSDPQVMRAKTVFLQLADQGITKAEIDKARKEIAARLQYGLDTAYNPRPIVGDDTLNLNERGYGNADVTGPDASHGTHVAGIIGAVRGNGSGAEGIAPSVRLMVVRAVPSGDERDKDIANAIRYAVDNGAQVINMSFGKAFSPQKAAVDAAVKYADAHGVLMVHAAGNDGANNDSVPSFPTPRYLDGGRPQNWIEVGASSWKGGANLAAEFSNYGARTVDIFAPGVDVFSTVPGGTYERESGTSMAAPVVSGVAALVMAYYPQLSAADVKQILLNSATRHPTQRVRRPGEGSMDEVAFGALSATGGIVNAYAAIRMAEEVVRRSRDVRQ